MTNLDKEPCFQCALSGYTIKATIRIWKALFWPLYFCEFHYVEEKKKLHDFGMSVGDTVIQDEGFTCIEE